MKKRYVIYSAMAGAYDDILQPKVVDERFDYILFCNEIKEKRVGVWEVRPIPYYNDDNTRICRYVKTHPDELLKEYEVSVWMDSNIHILTDYMYHRVTEMDKEDILFSAMWHPVRKCIYEEAFAVVYMMVEHEGVVVDWCHKLRIENYPRNYGLYETCVLYRKHKSEKVREVDAFWWQCIENYSRRDQLSCNYALWKHDMPIYYFFGEGKNARNTEHLELIMHNDIRHNHCPIVKNEAWLMRHCWKHKEDKPKIAEIYYRLYGRMFPKFWIALAGQFYRIKDRLKVNSEE